MKILSFDTAFSACSVGVLNTDAHPSIVSFQKIIPMQQSQFILGMIEDTLKRSNLSLSDLDAIAYVNGPGSFTGVRIAESIAQAFSFSKNIPLIKISSMAAMAQTVYKQHKYQHFMIGLDAKGGQIHWACYSIIAGIAVLQGKESLGPPGEIKLHEINEKVWCGIGDAWEIYTDRLENRLAQRYPRFVFPTIYPAPEAILELAIHQIRT